MTDLRYIIKTAKLIIFNLEVLIINIIEKILALNNIVYKNIVKSQAGFTNMVYFVDDKYVIKIVERDKKDEKLVKEINFYKNIKLDFIPRYIASGNVDGTTYLIIKKIKGCSLFHIWHKLSQVQREKVVVKIVKILKCFHKQNFQFLQEKYILNDLQESMQKSFDINIEVLKNKGFDTTLLQDFKETKLKNIFKQQKPCLIYNDAHFDNFIYRKGKIYLIDFDRVKYCSVDNELLIILQMLDNPKKFANIQDEKYVDKKDYQFIYNQLKTLYSQLFDFKYINERLFIYQFMYQLGQAYEYDNNQEITKLLKNFKEYFYKKSKV